jgi:SAM-dependent methyltransferase
MDCLARAFLAAAGVGDDFRERIHAADEMYRVLPAYGVPPERLALDYYRSGLQAWRSVAHALRTAGKEPADLGSFLDFASGFGRMTRFLVREVDRRRVWASDIDAQAVLFLQEELGVHGVVSCIEPASLRFDRRFEVVYAGSLFSHLPERRFEAWLRRLFELLEPGGVLLFSTHGVEAHGARPDPRGFAYVPQSETTRLDPADYGTAYVAPDFVRRVAGAAGVAGLFVVERELWYNQDLYAAVNEPNPGLSRWRQAPVVWGEIRTAVVDAARWARIGGAAFVPRTASPLRAVEVEVPGAGRFAASWRPAAAAANAPADFFVPFEWFVEGDATALPGGECVAAVATLAGGERTCFDAAPLRRPE